jgi:hypothetical protein
VAVGIFFGGWHLGSKLKQGEWDKERVSNAIALSTAIADANAKVLATEHALNNKIASISAVYETKLQEKQNEKNRLIAINSSNGLFINARASTNQPANGNTTASTSLSDGTSRVRLSESDGRFLINFASDADQVANQLSECQAVIYADRGSQR